MEYDNGDGMAFTISAKDQESLDSAADMCEDLLQGTISVWIEEDVTGNVGALPVAVCPAHGFRLAVRERASNRGILEPPHGNYSSGNCVCGSARQGGKPFDGVSGRYLHRGSRGGDFGAPNSFSGVCGSWQPNTVVAINFIYDCGDGNFRTVAAVRLRSQFVVVVGRWS